MRLKRRRAVPKHTDSSRRKLRFIQAELELAEETGQWADRDQEFHQSLYARCDRPRTLEMIVTLRDAVQRFYRAEMRHADHQLGWKREHRRILKAVEENDVDAACAALGAHLRETERVVQSRLIQLGKRKKPKDEEISGGNRVQRGGDELPGFAIQSCAPVDV
jgi:DNA-binding GntR family transcriptional regulator